MLLDLVRRLSFDPASKPAPRQLAPEAPRVLVHSAGRPEVSALPPAVLIVDDDPRVRSFLRAALQGNARVLEAADGEQAFAMLQKQARPDLDLVLVDYVLPGRSGLEVLRLTKRRWPWVPVVVITGFGSEDLAVQALRAGASDYLNKPIELDRLSEVVRMLTTARAELPDRGDMVAVDRSDGGRVAHPRIRQAMAFVREHFTEEITLADVAREAALSRFHLCRLFHHEAGVSFRGYLHELRVTRAQILLSDQYLSVTEVAYAVGFNDLSHFDRIFSRIVGRSPSKYRRSLSNGGSSPRRLPIPMTARPGSVTEGQNGLKPRADRL